MSFRNPATATDDYLADTFFIRQLFAERMHSCGSISAAHIAFNVQGVCMKKKLRELKDEMKNMTPKVSCIYILHYRVWRRITQERGRHVLKANFLRKANNKYRRYEVVAILLPSDIHFLGVLTSQIARTKPEPRSRLKWLKILIKSSMTKTSLSQLIILRSYR